MRVFQKLLKNRRRIGFWSLISGALGGLSAFLFVPQEIGLCSRLDFDCYKPYEQAGEVFFLIFMGVFILGTLFFVLSRADRKKLRIFSLVFFIVGIIVYFTASTYSGGGWVFSAPSDREVIGWPMTIIYSAYIIGLSFRELLGGKWERMKRFGIGKLTAIIVFVILAVWMLIGAWL